MSEKNPERFALSQEQFDEIQSGDPDVDLLKVGVPGVGVVVLKPASRGDFKRFSKRINAGRDGGDAVEELARCCVAWPPLPELEAEIEKRRKYAAWTRLGNEAARLSGLIVEDLEGN